MINYLFFPQSQEPTVELQNIIECFKSQESVLDKLIPKDSNEVLNSVSKSLINNGYKVETDKKSKIKIPVLYGVNGKIEKSYDVDAISNDGKIVIEVEAGRAWANHQFLKDIFEVCLMPSVEYLVIAVFNYYASGKSNDFERICTSLKAMYTSRFELPLKGILLIGYGKAKP
jgi:hypothetical protein